MSNKEKKKIKQNTKFKQNWLRVILYIKSNKEKSNIAIAVLEKLIIW